MPQIFSLLSTIDFLSVSGIQALVVGVGWGCSEDSQGGEGVLEPSP